MIRDILYRLINKGRVVGWEWHKLGAYMYIVHGKDINRTDATTILGYEIYEEDGIQLARHPYYIQHDRKDQYTGVDVDGVKVFENDKIEFGGKEAWTMLKEPIVKEHMVGYIKMESGCWTLRTSEGDNFSAVLCYAKQHYSYIKHIGIKGVTNEGVIKK